MTGKVLDIAAMESSGHVMAMFSPWKTVEVVLIQRGTSYCWPTKDRMDSMPLNGLPSNLFRTEGSVPTELLTRDGFKTLLRLRDLPLCQPCGSLKVLQMVQRVRSGIMELWNLDGSPGP